MIIKCGRERGRLYFATLKVLKNVTSVHILRSNSDIRMQNSIGKIYGYTTGFCAAYTVSYIYKCSSNLSGFVIKS